MRSLSFLLPLATLTTAQAQAPAGRIPMGTGATIVQTLSAVGADRESLHRVRLVSDSGLTVPGTREPPSSPGTKRFSKARDGRQVRLGSGIRQVAALPGPRGVRLVFDVDHSRVAVQFSQKPPWDERQPPSPTGGAPGSAALTQRDG